MSIVLEKIERVIGKGRIKEHEPLRDHTALKLDGTAEYYLEVESMDVLVKTVREARAINIPICIFGMGSWIQFADKQIAGLVIKNNCHRFDLNSFRGKVKDQTIGVDHASVYAEAGANMNQLVRFTLGEGLGGLEYQLGLPGSVGGAIYTNARYTPKSLYVSDVVEEMRVLTESGELVSVSGDHFVSRSADAGIFAKEIILSAIFRLQPQDSKLLWERGMEAAKYRNEVTR